MSHIPEFQQQQRRFLHYLRRPQSSALPEGFAPERAAVYVGLLYNKFNESLSTCFPIIRKILSREDWRALLLDFIAEHRCLTPYYRRIPDEFVQYLREERHRSGDLPFLAELAHYEWMELQLSISDAEPFAVEPLTGEQLLAGVPVFAPVMQLLHYRWPVQAISPAFLPTELPQTASWLLGFRDAGDRVHFIALNPATARLIALLAGGFSGRQALDALGNELGTDFRETVQHFGLETLIDLHRRGAIIAAMPPNFIGAHR
ncbi:MAG: putative DNA-binding domain-containing protein [Methylomonas sp.]|nr:putative DNA-binding domain-containing protein [Methylomonas sp.]